PDDGERPDARHDDRVRAREEPEQEAGHEEEGETGDGRPDERHHGGGPPGAHRAFDVAHPERLPDERARRGGELDAREERERLDLTDDLVRRDLVGPEAENEARKRQDAEAERRALARRRPADGEDAADRRRREMPGPARDRKARDAAPEKDDRRRDVERPRDRRRPRRAHRADVEYLDQRVRERDADD